MTDFYEPRYSLDHPPPEGEGWRPPCDLVDEVHNVLRLTYRTARHLPHDPRYAASRDEAEARLFAFQDFASRDFNGDET